ncbi:hypothetical protein D9M71_280210 [compost metagenome]
MPCPVGRHVRRRCLGRVEKALEVGVDDAVHLFFGVLGDGLGNENAGVIDQDVDLAEGFNGLGKQGLGGLRPGNVAGNQQQVGRVAQSGGGCLQAVQGAGIADHVVATGKVGLSDGKTQPAGGTGDNHGLIRVHGRIPQLGAANCGMGPIYFYPRY